MHSKNPEGKTVLVIAGEASGDMHAAALVKELRNLDSSFRFYGVGGEELRNAGMELIADSAEMAVIGLTEVLLKLPHIIKVMRQVKDSLTSVKPSVVVLIDYPDFNLQIARAANHKGIKVFYYISPQVWAWRKGRINKIQRYVDQMAVILPFEVPIYQERGVDAVFVGHPLLDGIPSDLTKEEARKTIGLPEQIMTISLLPGSRSGEVARHLPICMEAAGKLKLRGDIQFVLPLASTLTKAYIDGIIGQYDTDVLIVSDHIYDVLKASDLAIVASGTATLQAALTETPMIVIYIVSRLSYLIGKIFIKVKNISLVNIIAGKTIVPELIQDEANPNRISELAYDLLSDCGKRAVMISELSTIRNRLGVPGAAARAARLIYDLLGLTGK